MTSNNGKQTTETQLGGLINLADRSDQVTEVNDHLWVSKDISDSILVTTSEGGVVINTGMPGNGGKHKQRYRNISSLPIRYIIITQCHGDHFGGAHEIKDSTTQIITQERFLQCRGYWKLLNDFYTGRSNKLWGSILGDRAKMKEKIREVSPDLTVADDYRFELGGRHFELIATPGGESEDGLVVWLPQDRTVITGNLFGPVFGNLPNLYTIRGDKIRSAMRFVKSLDRVLALKPDLVVSGHEVIEGEERIRSALTKVREAVMYVHDQTIEGMNAGKDVYTLMREIKLPENLQIGQAHGKLAWCVRAIWEEYAGWFHYDSTTSLYGAPASSVAADIVELAGGADQLAQRAEQYLDKQQPLEALHLTDIALNVEPSNPLALQVKIAAHQQLLKLSRGENFSEVMWLKSEIAVAQVQLSP